MQTTSLLSIRQASAETGRSQPAIRYLIKQKRLRVVRLGWSLFIPRSELQKLTPDASGPSR